MASRTPKHMPRWVARRTRSILYDTKYTAAQMSSSPALAAVLVPAVLEPHRDVQIEAAQASGAIRGKVERLAVGGDVRLLIPSWAVEDAEVHRRGPRVLDRASRRRPEVQTAESTGPR